MINALFFALFAAIYWLLTGEGHQNSNALFIGACLIAYFINRHHVNIVMLLAIILLFRVGETSFWLFVDLSKHAYIHYSIQILINVAVIAVINARWRIYYKLNKNASKDEAYYTNADFSLILIYFAYIVVIILAMGEHLLRHLDDVGFPAEYNMRILVIYNNYEYLKGFINLVESATLLAAFKTYFRSERFVHA